MRRSLRQEQHNEERELQEITRELQLISERLEQISLEISERPRRVRVSSPREDHSRRHSRSERTSPRTRYEETSNFNTRERTPNQHRARDYSPGDWRVGDIVQITNHRGNQFGIKGRITRFLPSLIEFETDSGELLKRAKKNLKRISSQR